MFPIVVFKTENIFVQYLVKADVADIDKLRSSGVWWSGAWVFGAVGSKSVFKAFNRQLGKNLPTLCYDRSAAE
jgi:hypothetical protein